MRKLYQQENKPCADTTSCFLPTVVDRRLWVLWAASLLLRPRSLPFKMLPPLLHSKDVTPE